MSDKKKEYAYSLYGELDLVAIKFEEDETAELLSAYARFTMSGGSAALKAVETAALLFARSY